jgi:hypothetical protein
MRPPWGWWVVCVRGRWEGGRRGQLIEGRVGCCPGWVAGPPGDARNPPPSPPPPLQPRRAQGAAQQLDPSPPGSPGPARCRSRQGTAPTGTAARLGETRGGGGRDEEDKEGRPAPWVAAMRAGEATAGRGPLRIGGAQPPPAAARAPRTRHDRVDALDGAGGGERPAGAALWGKGAAGGAGCGVGSGAGAHREQGAERERGPGRLGLPQPPRPPAPRTRRRLPAHALLVLDLRDRALGPPIHRRRQRCGVEVAVLEARDARACAGAGEAGLAEAEASEVLVVAQVGERVEADLEGEGGLRGAWAEGGGRCRRRRARQALARAWTAPRRRRRRAARARAPSAWCGGRCSRGRTPGCPSSGGSAPPRPARGRGAGRGVSARGAGKSARLRARARRSGAPTRLEVVGVALAVLGHPRTEGLPRVGLGRGGKGRVRAASRSGRGAKGRALAAPWRPAAPGGAWRAAAAARPDLRTRCSPAAPAARTEPEPWSSSLG